MAGWDTRRGRRRVIWEAYCILWVSLTYVIVPYTGRAYVLICARLLQYWLAVCCYADGAHPSLREWGMAPRPSYGDGIGPLA
eukprot:5242590-Pleurochrysis_carterae.AAC.3